ncbi:hypothetical protein ACQTPQ_06225 [Streptococcus hyovaginalis]|uniref:hypothetical protein n=1 Tax=Streptococcus hyovaginalis TaxID=149015 RepID=UPI003ADF67AD
MKKQLYILLAGLLFILTSCSNTASTVPSSNKQEERSQTPSTKAPQDKTKESLITATSSSIDFTNVKTPDDLAEQLATGGYVIVFRYTGAGGQDSPIPDKLRNLVIDDGQRISQSSVSEMAAYGQKVKDLNIPLDRVITSEYYFVWQHAQAAFGDDLDISRDLTGSLNFDDAEELETSLQNLRNRTVTPPPVGKNTFLFTHQGKFDKAYGFYPPAGTSIIFKPDGTGKPNLVAVLTYDDFLNL